MLHGPTEPDFEMRLSFWHTCPKPDGGVHNESTVESLSLALVSAQKMDNETLFTNLYIYLAYTIHKVTVPATFIVLWPDLSSKLGKELPSFSDSVAIIFCGVGGGGEEPWYRRHLFCPLIISAPDTTTTTSPPIIACR